jgi:hypothetical protein
MSQVGFNLMGDLKAAKKIHLPWWLGLTLAVSAAFCAAMFDHLHRIELTLPVMNSVIVFGYLIRLRWRLRDRVWFWLTMLVCAALHVPLIMAIPWTTKWVPPVAVAVFDAVDFCVILLVLALLERMFDGRLNSGGRAAS